MRVTSRSLREQIAQDLLDKILERAESGVDINGKRFKGYSKQYINSDSFKAFGKDPSKVNLRLTGDMLELLDVIQSSPDEVVLGWTDVGEAKKAYGHIEGTGKLPKRDFFGLTNSDIQDIKRIYKTELESGDTFEETILLEGLNSVDEG